MATDKNIEKLVHDFVARLSALVAQATRDEVSEAIRKAIGAGGARGGRGRGRRSFTPVGPVDALGRRRKRTEGQLETQSEKLFDYIKSNPGERMETISDALGQPSTLLAPLVRRLIADKRVKAKGKARGTTYAAF
jgi:hypothetical protein